MVTLHRDGEQTARFVASLVLEAFVGPRPEGQETRHMDGNPQNNHLSNLCWGTPLENSDDKRRHGTICFGSRHGLAKLTEAQVVEIRRRRAYGESPKALAQEFGVSQPTVSMACLGERWIHLQHDASLPPIPRKKLNVNQVREIRRRLDAGERQSRIAQDFGIKQVTVSDIKLRRIWADIA